jgi:23S rRNA (cytosine1962-C5)-methyltransferase
VLHRESAARRLEGLELREPEAYALGRAKADSLTDAEFAAQMARVPVLIGAGVTLECDLLNGQKTGLFLDQSANIDLLARHAASLFRGKPVRVLDLCCYVGQWSVRLAHALKAAGCEVEVTAVDVSKTALEFAARNLAQAGATVTTQALDVLRDLETLEGNAYDIVVCDPPAFAKSRKDLPTALRAYAKLNAQAFRLARAGGLVASCSCSGLVSGDDFREAVHRALQRTERAARCLGTGGHASDHPTLLGFPEGTYLKMFLHRIESAKSA